MRNLSNFKLNSLPIVMRRGTEFNSYLKLLWDKIDFVQVSLFDNIGPVSNDICLELEEQSVANKSFSLDFILFEL